MLLLIFPDIAFAQTWQCETLAQCVSSGPIVTAWRIVLGMVNSLAILGLIFIALANMLRVNLETYHIRRLLPGLIIGIILANFSHLICRIFIDFASVLTYWMWTLPGQPINGEDIARVFGFGSLIAQGFGAAGVIAIVSLFLTGSISGPFGIVMGIIGILMGLFLFLFPILLILFLALLLYGRVYVIWFLVIISPLAFFSLVFTPLQSVWKFWWGWWLKWLFLAPIAFFILAIAVIIARTTGW